MALNPRKLLGMEPICIREGGRAELSLFLPHEKWTVEPKHLYSKSANSPLLGETLTGMPIGVVHRGKAEFFNH
jgi:dihydroorotase